MFEMSRPRLIATLIAAATLGLAMVLANGIPPEPRALIRTVVPMILGAGLAQWLLFPLFTRREGAVGLALDVALWLGHIALAGLFAGTLVMPGAGTILGPMVTLSLPLQSPVAALVYALGAALGLRVIRRARFAALATPPA
ncbi:MAG: hypothetical protein Q7J44_12375 [Pseudotabrizicola sp.]|uniref:hypothetical protein n=1 Tax=Pseudotabrizicola sp. TaxID=2939647 RepID=UPI002723057E|nr:hypothetical protein [Pseudotabrizicola sp.]MDO9639326.1 hypothetical protein [Pseudotabrizicola sp.]